MFMGETSDKREAVIPAGMNTFALVLGILACATVILGIAPGYVIEVVSRALQY
jgi:hypothetical protein